MKNRKKYSSEFKGEVALSAIKGEETLASLAQRYELHPTQIALWRTEALKGFSSLFDQGKPKKDEMTPQVNYLERKVGQLTIEIDVRQEKSGVSCG